MDKVYVLSFNDTWSTIYGVFTSFEAAKETMLDIMEDNDEIIDGEIHHYGNEKKNCYWVSNEYFYSIDEFELNVLE